MDGGYQLLAELPDVLRFGAGVGQNRHLLIDLGGGLQAESALFVAGHVSIARIGELGTGRLWVDLHRQQEHNQPRQEIGTSYGCGRCHSFACRRPLSFVSSRLESPQKAYLRIHQ